MESGHSILYLVGFALLVAVALSFVSGCSYPTPRLICPPLTNYSQTEEKNLALELRNHPDLKEVPVFLRDYGNERAECRAIEHEKARD